MHGDRRREIGVKPQRNVGASAELSLRRRRHRRRLCRERLRGIQFATPRPAWKPRDIDRAAGGRAKYARVPRSEWRLSGMSGLASQLRGCRQNGGLRKPSRYSAVSLSHAGWPIYCHPAQVTATIGTCHLTRRQSAAMVSRTGSSRTRRILMATDPLKRPAKGWQELARRLQTLKRRHPACSTAC